MPNFCTKVMQTFLKQKSDIFSDGIYKIILGNGWLHIFLIDSKCIVSLIFYHEKYHFLLELLSLVDPLSTLTLIFEEYWSLLIYILNQCQNFDWYWLALLIGPWIPDKFQASCFLHLSPTLFADARCPIARHRTIKDIEENNWSHGTNVRCCAARHRTAAVLKTTKWTFLYASFAYDFHFLHKPIVYGVAHLLYGVALSDSVWWSFPDGYIVMMESMDRQISYWISLPVMVQCSNKVSWLPETLQKLHHVLR